MQHAVSKCVVYREIQEDFNHKPTQLRDMTINNSIYFLFPECGAAFPPTLFGQASSKGTYDTEADIVKTKEMVITGRGAGNEGKSPDEGKQLGRSVKTMRKSAKERENQSHTRRNVENGRKHKEGLVKSKYESKGKSKHQRSKKKNKKHQRSNKKTRPKTRMNTRPLEFGEGQERDMSTRVQGGKANKKRLEYPYIVSVRC